MSPRGQRKSIGVQTSQRVVAGVAAALVAVVAGAAIALSPLGPSRYQAAMAAVGAVTTVAAIGLAAVGLAADHSRQRSDATLNFMNDVLDQDRERLARVNRWLKDSGVTAMTPEQAADLRTRVDLRPRLDDLRDYLNHLERLALGVRTGIFDAEIVAMLGRSRVVNARYRFAAFLSTATDSDLTGTPTRNYEHLRWLVDEEWRAVRAPVPNPSKPAAQPSSSSSK